MEISIFNKSKYKRMLKAYGLPFIFRQLLEDIAYSYQRIQRGWSDMDSLFIDDWFSNIITPMLERLASNHDRIPAKIEYDYFVAHSNELEITYNDYMNWNVTDSNISYYYNIREEIDYIWKNKLLEMIELSKSLNQNGNKLKNREENKKKFFSMMCEYYDDLWF